MSESEEDLKKRIAAETRICGLTQQLQAKLAAAVGNCEALGALAPEVKIHG